MAVLFAVLVVGFVVARESLVPDTFGERGHYRAAAVDMVIAREMKYAGHLVCAICHDVIAEKRLMSHHQSVACEVCHGPGASHVESPGEVLPPAPRQRGLCPLCHSYDPSRPTGFPQIDPVAHNPLEPCMSCHDPHAPELHDVPGECEACHGQIARQKRLSHHVTLSCTTCHVTQEGHESSPRLVRPGKPMQRSFCATCHAEEADSPVTIPRINVNTHGEDYLCWQCHYPHYPETG